MMSYNLIVWVILNLLAVWYFLYLWRRGRSIVTNTAQLCESLDEQQHEEKNPKKLALIQSTLHAAVKTLYTGLLYSLVSAIGVVALAVMNLLLLSQ